MRPIRDGVLGGSAVFLVCGLCLTVLYLAGVRALDQEVRTSLIRTAQTAAALVDGNLHAALRAPEQEQGEAYRQAVEPLRKILQGRDDIRFLYTMVLLSNGVHFVLDATPPGDADHDGVEDHSALMDPYLESAPAMQDALRTGRAQTDPAFVEDSWGTYLSGYAAIRDRQGRQTGVVGVDMRLDTFARKMATMRRALGWGVGVAWLACMIVGVVVWWLRRNTLQIERQRARADQALRESESHYRTLVQNTPDILMRLDAKGRFLFVSAPITECVDREAAAFSGRTHRELGFPPAECEFWESRIRAVIESGAPIEEEHEWATRSGRRIFNLRLLPEVGEGGQAATVFGIDRDITRHRTAEREYRMLFEQMIDGFALHEIVCDAEGTPVDYRFLTVNPAFERQTGLKADHVVGKRVREIQPSIEAERIDVYGQVALTGQPAHFEYYHKESDRYYEVTAYCPLSGQFACLYTDVTARRRVEEERRAIQEQLLHSQKLEGLGLLAGGIAHDFNNLLMAILGNADLALEDAGADAAVRPYLEQIKTVSMRAAELCGQMLAYSGRGKFRVGPVNLSHVVREMSNLLAVSVSKSVLVRYELTESLPLIEADATQLRQVVMNLVINASESMDAKSGVVSVRTGVRDCDEAFLRGAYAGEEAGPGPYVFLEVADTGCGMDAETRARIFEPFFTTKFTGRGLGLAATLGIVRGHKGAIRVASEPGRGSTFTLLFPIAAQTPMPGEEVVKETRWTGTGTILLVDDDETVLALNRRILNRAGFQVLTARDGRQGVELFRARAGELACVVMDLTMPHMSGDEAFRAMHRIRPEVPVILASGYTEQEIAQRFSGEGVAAFIQKPYPVTQLRQILQQVLGSARPRAEG